MWIFTEVKDNMLSSCCLCLKETKTMINYIINKWNIFLKCWQPLGGVFQRKEISCHNWFELPSQTGSPGYGEEVLCWGDRQKKNSFSKENQKGRKRIYWELVKSGKDQITRHWVPRSCWGFETCKIARGREFYQKMDLVAGWTSELKAQVTAWVSDSETITRYGVLTSAILGCYRVSTILVLKYRY